MERALTLLLLLLQGIIGLEIPDDVSHPIIIERGNTGSVVLDCDYDVTEEGEKAQLEVKWYFNDEPSPFYIWVPSGGRKPQLIGSEFENHVDLEYVANEDAFKAYSSVRLLNPTTKMSGTYVCKVSTFENEEYLEKNLIIYSPPDEILLAFSSDDIDEEKDENGEVPKTNVTCIIKGVFPEPQVQLTWKEKGDDEDEDSSEGSGIFIEAFTESIYSEEEGFYDLIVSYTIDDQEVFGEKNELLLGCELLLAEAEFHLAEHVSYSRKTIKVETDETGSGSGDPCQDDPESSGCSDLDFSGSGLNLDFSGSGSGCDDEFSGCDVGSGFEFSGSGEFSGEEGDYEIVTDDPDPTSDEVPDANGDDIDVVTSGCERLGDLVNLLLLPFLVLMSKTFNLL